MQLHIEKKRITILCFLITIVAGFVLRIVACFYGYPGHFHPDEPTIVENAIDMISRHSWYANVYNRPDHFEIKCCAALFQIVSYLKYHVSADIAFINHKLIFYLVARGYTTIFGTLMIPLAYLLMEKLKEKSGIWGAAIVAFNPIFIEHSAYATPDIVLTVTVMFIAILSLMYWENPSFAKVVVLSIVAGVGITIKYTCAISCIWIAIIVIATCIKRKEYVKILEYGLIACVVVLFTCCIIAPNLFTNISETISTIRLEARTTHLGADGLGFFGNLIFYFKAFFVRTGWEAILLFLVGIGAGILSKKREWLVFGLGLLFWICTSVLALHWERWGMPMYIFFAFLVAMGMNTVCVYSVNKIRTKTIGGWIATVISCVIVGLVLCNGIVSGISYDMHALTQDTRILAFKYCDDNNITSDNSLYDGYSPFNVRNPDTITVDLDKQGNIKLNNEQEQISFFILSSGMFGRYYAEPDRYSQQVSVYNAIMDQCKLVAQYSPTDYPMNSWAIKNIVLQLQYINNYSSKEIQGPVIMIYKYNGK